MTDELYDTDILAWSLTQAERLRRVAAGERVNDVDWEHVIEEVEDLGKSELRSVTSLLRNALLHALNVAAYPDHPSVDHWTHEIAVFLANARDRFEPGMRQYIDPAELFEQARDDFAGLPPMSGPPPLPVPAMIAVQIDELRNRRFGAADLLERLRASQAPPDELPVDA